MAAAGSCYRRRDDEAPVVMGPKRGGGIASWEGFVIGLQSWPRVSSGRVTHILIYPSIHPSIHPSIGSWPSVGFRLLSGCPGGVPATRPSAAVRRPSVGFRRKRGDEGRAGNAAA